MNKRAKIIELENKLSYLFDSEMTNKQKIKVLSNAYFQVFNSNYCDAMANKLMSGINDFQTELWEKNCNYKYQINELLSLLEELNEEN